MVSARPWTAAGLALLLTASATLNVRQWKQIGAARTECEVTKLEETKSRSDAVRDLETESLRERVAQLEGEIARTAEREKLIRAVAYEKSQEPPALRIAMRDG